MAASISSSKKPYEEAKAPLEFAMREDTQLRKHSRLDEETDSNLKEENGGSIPRMQ